MSVPESVTFTREQLADVLYSAVVQGRDTIWNRSADIGAVLNEIAEGIADSVFARPPPIADSTTRAGSSALSSSEGGE